MFPFSLEMKKKNIPFHPALFAIFPILSLYVANMNRVSIGEILPTLMLVMVVTLLVWSALFVLTRDRTRSAIAISIFLFFFFSFAHILTAISVSAEFFHRYENIRTLVETRNGMLLWLVVELLVVGGIIYRIYRSKRDLLPQTRVLNFLSIIMVVTVLSTWASTQINLGYVQASSNHGNSSFGEDDLLTSLQPVNINDERLPDIYYIILDGYGRSDILDEIYNLDNGDFLSSLESKGFFVAEDSNSNYPRTGLSFASSLNAAYLDRISQQLGQESENLLPLKSFIENSFVFQQLRQAGYKIITFPSGYELTEISSSDQIISTQATPDSVQNLLINNTPLSIFLLGKQYDWHRQRITYTIDQLPEVSNQDQPTFVFAHILAPHPPFVFGSNGESINPSRKYGIDDGNEFLAVANQEEYLNGYRDQLVYINSQIINSIERIMASSSTQPVIIIQGDHGPRSSYEPEILEGENLVERMAILNAYLLPGIDPSLLYPGITPVNTFRLLFNAYLGTNYPLLEDRSYYSTNDQPFQFTDVTSRLDN